MISTNQQHPTQKHKLNSQHSTVAIIAGTGCLPLQAANTLQEKNISFFIISLFPEDNLQELLAAAPHPEQVITEKYYRIGDIKKTLLNKKATDVLFIGKVDKRNLLKKLSFDWEALTLLGSLAYKHDTSIMELVVQTVEKIGINVIHQNDILEKLHVEPGVLCGTITPEIEKSIAAGISMASKLSECDIGQTVVVKDTMIIAVEAIEGTDECIRRGISLGKKDVIVCKTAQEKHNNKYDMPTLGPATLEKIQLGEVAAIAWQANKTLIANKSDFIKQAEVKKITLVAL